MKRMEEMILKEGKILPGGVLKVGSFLNQQVDIHFMKEIGDEVARLYKDAGATKILTIESSGIPIAISERKTNHRMFRGMCIPHL